MFSNLFKELTIMKTLHRTLLMAAMLAAPFAAAQAHETDAAHRAWLKAQQIDIKPTLTITETEIPAGSSATSTGTGAPAGTAPSHMRSEEHTSELQSLMRISYAVFCLKKKKPQ